MRSTPVTSHAPRASHASPATPASPAATSAPPAGKKPYFRVSLGPGLETALRQHVRRNGLALPEFLRAAVSEKLARSVAPASARPRPKRPKTALNPKPTPLIA